MKILILTNKIFNVINAVTDSIWPTYGVELIGANLKINTQDNLNDSSNKNKNVLATKDDKTGMIRAKGLPYTYNPKLSITTTRKEFYENGIVGVKANRTMKNFLKSKHKFSHSLSHTSTDGKLDDPYTKSHLNTNRTDNYHFLSQNNTIQNEGFEETIEVLNTNRTNRPLVQFPSSKLSNYQTKKLLLESNDIITNNQSYFDFSLDDMNLNTKTNLNASMAISNNPKITIQMPNSRDSWLSKSKIVRSQKRSLEVRDQFRDSILSMRSDITDRLVDYKNNKNLRK